MLLVMLGNQPPFVYQNETEIQYFVTAALSDAVAVLGLSDVLRVRPEISLFSYRPDIIVVQHSSYGIVLIVEVKKPGKDVFTSHSVRGQVYDYLVGTLGVGISCPFALLSTYEQMVIAHLDDEGGSQELLKQVAGNMGQDLEQEIAFLKAGAGQVDKGQGTAKPPGVPLSHLNPVVLTFTCNNENDHETDDVITNAVADENKNDHCSVSGNSGRQNAFPQR